MKTNFSQYLKSARRATILILLTIISYLLVLAAIWAAMALVFKTVFANCDASWSQLFWCCGKEPTSRFFTLALAALFVAYATTPKLRYLKRGGACDVAEDLGGKPFSKRNRDEARFYEAVEETARGFGVPVPAVYILRDEEGINVCAIGAVPESAAILATAGAIRLLTRDELQGVVAHEFGSLLNGDAKTNMGLIWALACLQALSFYGLEWRCQTRGDKRGGNDKEGAEGAALASVCYIVGLPGLVLAALVRSAITRSRKKRADKAAVEFTQNPLALAGALKKMDGASFVKTPRAREFAHLFVGSISPADDWGAFRTHPRLSARILAFDPDFDGAFSPLVEETSDSEGKPEGPRRPEAKGLDVAALAEKLVATLDGQTPERLDGLEAALDDVPEEIKQSLTDFDGARTVVFALLLERTNLRVLKTQAKMIFGAETLGANRTEDEARQFKKRVARAAQALWGASFSTRAAVVRLAIAPLKLGTLEQYQRFRATTEALCNADGRIDLFELALQHSAISELDVWFELKGAPAAKHGTFGGVNVSTQTALSYLAYVGANGNAEKARRAFESAVDLLLELEVYTKKPELQRFEDISLKNFKEALERMTLATPRIKENLLRVFLRCVAADGRVTEEEAELFDAMALALGVSGPVWRRVIEATQRPEGDGAEAN